MSMTTVAVTQMSCGPDMADNLDRAEELVRKAADRGAQVILLQELFAGPYFCKVMRPEYFVLASESNESQVISRMEDLARTLGVVLPVSFFECCGQAYFNSLVMLDADGSRLGLYRKAHIPQGPGYEEKYYFSPGNTGFKVWDTRFGKIGVGICWDQWFPEAARCMALMGADVLLYPTAIGSEPDMPSYDSCGHWQRTMQGHAAASMIPVCAANRVGTESDGPVSLTFYGSSFIADIDGRMLAEADREGEAVLTASFDFEEIARRRAGWGLFRDRRPDCYAPLLRLDRGPGSRFPAACRDACPVHGENHPRGQDNQG
jgi:N-carbamoylputrescine amidase